MIQGHKGLLRVCCVPQPSEHFEITLQDCGSKQKLECAAWGMPHFSPSPGPNGGKASEGPAGLGRICQAELQHLAKTCPAQNMWMIQGHTELLHVWRSPTFGALRRHTSRQWQRAEAAKCGVRRSTFFYEPRGERGYGKRRSCWEGKRRL
jgi:hypothetical protein